MTSLPLWLQITLFTFFISWKGSTYTEYLLDTKPEVASCKSISTTDMWSHCCIWYITSKLSPLEGASTLRSNSRQHCRNDTNQVLVPLRAVQLALYCLSAFSVTSLLIAEFSWMIMSVRIRISVVLQDHLLIVVKNLLNSKFWRDDWYKALNCEKVIYLITIIKKSLKLR